MELLCITVSKEVYCVIKIANGIIQLCGMAFIIYCVRKIK
jgi:hypothetical protein